MSWRTLGQSTGGGGGDDRRNVVVHQDNPLRFVAYVRDIIRIPSQISNWKFRCTIVVVAVDSKTFITAVLGSGFTVKPPKRVANCDVCALVCKAARKICFIRLGGYGDEEEEGEEEEEEGEREGKRVEKVGHGLWNVETCYY
ncbi:hypothetical protein L2E82_10244 [Cichorium intybus]|uniref:Uncharacterized protein n=1 Tax=Cichorium intybus TaxID=13427 RepID=A0ACB9GB28_CICIN|nr:hypothetical protein L2E82_10244 [Cichorium intybus]